MKSTLLGLSLLFCQSLYAQGMTVDGYDYQITDLAQTNMSSQTLYKSLNQDLIRLGGSICANRAHMWSYDLKRRYNVDTGKIFLFYTPERSGGGSRKTWWYHVAPVVAEKSELKVLDAGFPGSISGPLSVEKWLGAFLKGTNCKRINIEDRDLVELMHKGRQFPRTTVHGTFDCYYKIVPAGYRFPNEIAWNVLGTDWEGNPVRYSQDQIDREHVYQACIEAVTTGPGRMLGGGRKKCQKYLGMSR